MPATFHTTSLGEVILIKPAIFRDERGYFKETYHQINYKANGVSSDFVQDNFSRSQYGTLRGLHFQHKHSQAKLVQCLRGSIYDVAVDIRIDSPTLGQWSAAELSEENHHQLFVPRGFAHGFCVISEEADVHYKCSDLYTPEFDTGIRWDSIDIPWPIENPTLSDKDASLPRLEEVDRKFLTFS